MKHVSISIYDDETGVEEEWTLEAMSVVDPEPVFDFDDDDFQSLLASNSPKLIGYSVTIMGLQPLDDTGALLRIEQTDFL